MLAIEENADHVYVADTYGGVIREFTHGGVPVAVWGSPIGFDRPWGITVTSSGDFSYVADSENDRIQAFGGDGSYLFTWGSTGTGNGQFDAPCGIAIVEHPGDQFGDVFVADQTNHRIQRFCGCPVPANTTTWGRVKAIYR
ncbi:MAG: hypothetical protein A2W00_10120 [Candidatus Eisenbacteria bacterium RBG_16_71_46]|nr:MAG: hypothetical protein A2W00_10120 [Candidatus Eisenbacteria bacterium RBG_16_71_46]